MTADLATIERLFTLFLEPGAVVEIRIPDAGRNGTLSGYFDTQDAFVNAAAQWSGQVPAIYMTMNPRTPALLARSTNRLTARAKQTTSDVNILHRRWLLIDFDPVRPAGISSTDAEHAAALQRAQACRAWLRDRGWPEPVYADSGNGAHLPYRIDLPNDDTSRALIKRCLEAVALYHSDHVISVDLTTFNATRIWKVYGTMACKGDNVPERPHRLSWLLDVPTPV